MSAAAPVILLTGAAGGIGRDCAQRFSAAGARLVLTDLNVDTPELRQLAEQPDRVRLAPADVASAEDAARVAAEAVARFGRIDALINAAALFATLKKRPFEELSVAEWEKVLAINVIGPFNFARAVAATMKAQRSGRIVNIASNVVHKGLPNLLHYVASKGAVVAMTRALARELGPFGITVNAVAPGYVLHENTSATDAGRNEQVIRLRALGRTQTPADLFGVLRFLAMEGSDFITGQTIVVDGGEVFA